MEEKRMKTKHYAVEVLEKRSHGIYGKDMFQRWCLQETSKAGAVSFGYEIIAGMTYDELLGDFCKERNWNVRDMLPFGIKPDDIIGHENATRYYTVRAYLDHIEE